MKTANEYDAIVVGAGVGGLTVAALLACEGRKVLLVEKSNRVGGRKRYRGAGLLVRVRRER